MSRRFLVVTVAMLSFAAPLALAESAKKAADEACTPDANVARVQAEPLDLHALFVDEKETPRGLDVVVARIGADGKPVVGCVTTEEAARRFFAATERSRHAEEQ